MSHNPFDNNDVAARYQEHRPLYHKIPFALVRDFVGRDFEKALDVACGTGHSTHALSKISKAIVGVDQSTAMVLEAQKNYPLNFLCSSAESLPFEDNQFDLINISMGFHWVDQQAFLKESKRLLRPKGFLCVDNFGFTGEISKDPKKQKRHHDFFERCMPPARRSPGYPDITLLDATELHLVEEFPYSLDLKMSQETFCQMLTTWSNFQIQSSPQKNQAKIAMQSTYEPLFEGQELRIPFSGKAILIARYRSKT